MFKKIALGLAIVIAVVLIYAATRPDSFRVERSITINAPAEKIFPLINDFHPWEIWSPWEKIDPAVKRTYSGAQSGVGAAYTWQGDNQVGQGGMEIVESVPPSRILIKIDFMKPMAAHNAIEFTLEPQGERTKVTHAMFGPSPYISKLMGLVFSMDKMVGTKFDEGLNNLKALAEK